MANHEITLDMELPAIPTPIVKAIKAGNVLAQAAKITEVTDLQSEKIADTLRQELRAIFTVVDNRRLEVSRERFENPKKAFKAAVDEKLAPFKAEEERLWSLILTFRNEQARIKAEADAKAAAEAKALDEKRRKIQEAHAAKGHETKELIPTEVQKAPDVLASSTVKTRKIWTYDKDTINITKLPLEYHSIDFGKLTRAISGENGIHEIPGVKIYQKDAR